MDTASICAFPEVEYASLTDSSAQLSLKLNRTSLFEKASDSPAVMKRVAIVCRIRTWWLQTFACQKRSWSTNVAVLLRSFPFLIRQLLRAENAHAICRCTVWRLKTTQGPLTASSCEIYVRSEASFSLSQALFLLVPLALLISVEKSRFTAQFASLERCDSGRTAFLYLFDDAIRVFVYPVGRRFVEVSGPSMLHSLWAVWR